MKKPNTATEVANVSTSSKHKCVVIPHTALVFKATPVIQMTGDQIKSCYYAGFKKEEAVAKATVIDYDDEYIIIRDHKKGDLNYQLATRVAKKYKPGTDISLYLENNETVQKGQYVYHNVTLIKCYNKANTLCLTNEAFVLRWAEKVKINVSDIEIKEVK